MRNSLRIWYHISPNLRIRQAWIEEILEFQWGNANNIKNIQQILLEIYNVDRLVGKSYFSSNQIEFKISEVLTVLFSSLSTNTLVFSFKSLREYYLKNWTKCCRCSYTRHIIYIAEFWINKYVFTFAADSY